MVRDAAEHAEEDRQRRAEVGVAQRGGRPHLPGRAAGQGPGRQDLGRRPKAEIQTGIEAVREALKGTDAGVIDSTKQQLAEVLQRIGTRAYEAEPSPAADGSNGADGDGSAEGGGPTGRGRGRRGRRDDRGRVQGGLILRDTGWAVGPPPWLAAQQPAEAAGRPFAFRGAGLHDPDVSEPSVLHEDRGAGRRSISRRGWPRPPAAGSMTTPRCTPG